MKARRSCQERHALRRRAGSRVGVGRRDPSGDGRIRRLSGARSQDTLQIRGCSDVGVRTGRLRRGNRGADRQGSVGATPARRASRRAKSAALPGADPHRGSSFALSRGQRRGPYRDCDAACHAPTQSARAEAGAPALLSLSSGMHSASPVSLCAYRRAGVQRVASRSAGAVSQGRDSASRSQDGVLTHTTSRLPPSGMSTQAHDGKGAGRFHSLAQSWIRFGTAHAPPTESRRCCSRSSSFT